ncbi:MAG: phage head closure protein [Pelagibacterium sp.]|uniref:phage head closure protein n=1 Tax=Pelagibacterium sp. TaxID=1967288 RepID=UPI0032F07B13
MNRKVTQIRYVDTGETIGYGEPLFEDRPIRTFRAEMVLKTEDEEFAASQVYESRTVTFRTRFIADIEATDKIECEGRVCNVLGWREIGLRRGLEISARWTT